jgi:hypothetical protein
VLDPPHDQKAAINQLPHVVMKLAKWLIQLARQFR